MTSITLDPSALKNAAGKTAIVTGAAGGIGAHIVRHFANAGANVVVADLEYARSSAEKLIALLPEPSRSIFVPTNIIIYDQLKSLFKKTIEKFGSVEFVIANAGVMESKSGLDMDDVDENGELVDATQISTVIDINLKGTLNSEYFS
jgi:NAD(P)-dependent dehydrogenase (short-subunit alcohol dehydrogenase family)